MDFIVNGVDNECKEHTLATFTTGLLFFIYDRLN